MPAASISDQKRLVRGEQWVRARYFLRTRDKVHHRRWKILIVAGPAPGDEIKCIKELMPLSHITAVDLDEKNVLSAIDAGADEALVMDVGTLNEIDRDHGYSKKTVPPEPLCDLDAEDRFDAICLDLTGPANDWLRSVVSVYFTCLLKPRGVMIVTLSYGRDVVEAIDFEYQRALNRGGIFLDLAEHVKSLPDKIASRVWYVLRSTLTRGLDSCIQYRGARMPMLSCLIAKRDVPPAKFIVIDDTDFDLAVTAENLGNIYACPIERIIERRRALARKLAAHKAVQTKRKQITEREPVLAL